ncbi:4-hydroxybenzoate octaprenyltransferase [Chitinilyticum litopenaei]|uniref:4-hydroxybenzoate octaprenyltransferase n=1 Tax=Chitinilyticum litopenaei TaxID=1121276 RepID=UPI00048D5923|nr:4-hydroxybenzoate octaprenyltransferase [Chitinilyticum litopenaei]
MPTPLTARLSSYARLMRIDKPIGTLLLLWPTLWGLWLASAGRPDPFILLVFVAGTVLMRSAGCVINDYADRDFDGHVARTRARPLAAGEVSPKEALLLAALLALAAFLLVLPLNSLTLLLSLPAVFLAGSYPFTKRFLAIPQAYLGLAFSFGIPMAFAAQTGSVPALAWWLVAANLLWTVAYDTEYAMVDREDDLKIGIRTSAITFGRYDIAAILLCYAGFMAIWLGIALSEGLGWPLYAALAGALILIADQYRRIRGRERMACFAAFLANNRIGGLLFAGLLADFLLR